MRLLLIIVLSVATFEVLAQTDTTFTYQGELKQSGQPANGNFNLTFSLWDSLQNGSQVLGDLQINAVPVSEGTFTVNLDFGAHAFDNANRWLEIEVNGQTLAPRQFVSRSPYSIQTRGIYVASDGKVGIGTTAPGADLEINGAASPETGLLVREPGGATGQVAISSPGGETGIIAIANGGNRRDIRFTDAGISLLTNNAPTIPSTQNGLFINEFGYVGIGTTSPSGKLHANSVSAVPAIVGVSSGADGTALFGTATHSIGFSSGVTGRAASDVGRGVEGKALHTTGVNYGVYGETASDSGYAGYFVGGRNYFSGPVGIGIDPQPFWPLQVDGSIRLEGQPTGQGVSNIAINSSGILVRETSSRRYKSNIKPLDLTESSKAFLQLQPVSFTYNDTDAGAIGLIAEDVAELVPDIVTFDSEGRPEAVEYDKGVLYLLSIVKRQEKDLAELKALMARLGEE